MLEVREKIVGDLKRIVIDLTGEDVTPELSHPVDETHGDYSTNVAMVLFKNKGLRIKDKKYKNPLELAQLIVEELNNSSSIINNCSRIEAVEPGFINFWLSKDYLTTLIAYLIKTKDEYGRSGKLGNERIMIEFTDPNPFKEFHIGHLYSNTVGESLCRLLESQGALVWRVCYQGDVGLHIAKSLYAILQISNLKKKPSIDKVKFLGEAYAAGAKAYEENEKAKAEIERINKQIYEKDPKIMPLYKKGREWSLEYFDKIYSRLGTKFKRYYFESKAGEVGRKIVEKHISDVFKKSEGAVIFPAELYGLHNRVFINSLGLPTYEAKDLGLAPTKYKDFPYDLSIIITASEQSDYFRVVLKALSLIEPKLAAKTKHIAHGVVRLKGGKMSSRTGSVILGEWLLNEAKNRIITKYKEMDQNTAEMVAVGAVKYSLLKSGIGRDIAFNFEESISLEGNSGPYLQYTFARTQSVVRKSQISNLKSQININDWKIEIGKLKLEIEEVSLLRAINRFSEVIEEAAEKFAPNLLCNYLFDLAQKFNLFYQKHKILAASLGVNVIHPRGVIETEKFRISLTSATGIVIKNGLSLLGIQSPQRM